MAHAPQVGPKDMRDSDPLENQRLGRRGEAFFAFCCENNRLLPQKAGPDQMGWDYFVEVEPEIDHSLPLDREIDRQKILVQIKSTNRPSKSVRGSLSALKSLVDTDLPAFIAHIDFSNESSPRRALLLHIGATEIHTILKAVRQAEKRGRLDIHNIELALSLAKAVDIGDNGSILRSSLIAYMSSKSSEYVETKARLRRSCGWDENSIRVGFSIMPDQGNDALVDLLIGNIPEIRLSSAVIDKRRFGISLEKDTDLLSSGVLRVEARPSQKAKAIVSSHLFGYKNVEMELDVYAPNLPRLPKNLCKIRAANEFLDLTMHFGTQQGKMNFYIKPEQKYPLHVLSNALAFGVALSEDGAKIKINFGKPGSQTLNLPAEMKALSTWRMLCDYAETVSNAFFKYRKTVDCLVSFRDLEVSLESNRDMFALLSRPRFELTLYLDEDCPTRIPDNGAFIFIVNLSFSDYEYAAIVKADFRKILFESRLIKLIGGKPNVIEDGLYSNGNVPFSAIYERINEISRRDSVGGRCVISSAIC